MKKKASFFWGVIFIMVILTPSVYLFYLNYKETHFSCWAKSHATRGGQYHFSEFQLIFNSGQGELNSIVKYSDPNNKERIINANLKFTYKKDSDRIILVSSDSINDRSLITLLGSIVPDFFLQKDRGLSMRIFRQGNDAYIFTSEDIPLFICNKN
ncbi:hypothetical protein [Serratia sp. 2723]|uniref:hypothetical protein n=1 Tax=unclassified Serratia (in: enterobacteria) TaxID=2647522 RepID=UPI003D19C7EC